MSNLKSSCDPIQKNSQNSQNLSTLKKPIIWYILLVLDYVALGDSVYLEKYRLVCRELELLKQQKNSKYDEELDDLRATKRSLKRKV